MKNTRHIEWAYASNRRFTFFTASTILLNCAFLFFSYSSSAQTGVGDLPRLQQRDSAVEKVQNNTIQKTLAEPVYKIRPWRSVLFGAAATAANLYAISTIIHGKRDLTDAELQSINPLVPNGFDRWALHQDPSKRESYYKASDIALPGIILSATALAFDDKIRKDWVKLLAMFYEMHAFTFALYDFSPLGPAFQNKLRPITYYPYFSPDERRGGNQRNSMYSGHVASATATTFFMVKVYSDYHPEFAKKRFLWYALASLPPLAEGYLRVKALAHFPSDVLVGYVIGAICGVAVPELHRNKAHTVQLGLSSDGVSNGLRLAWNFGQKGKPALRAMPAGLASSGSGFNNTKGL